MLCRFVNVVVCVCCVSHMFEEVLWHPACDVVCCIGVVYGDIGVFRGFFNFVEEGVLHFLGCSECVYIIRQFPIRRGLLARSVSRRAVVPMQGRVRLP